MNWIRRFLLIMIIFLGSVHTTHASTVIPMDLMTMVRYSDRIFAGTVTAIEPYWTPSHNTIITQVTFSHLTYAKGDYLRTSITLNLRGGRVGSDEIIIDGMPQFAVGQRYITFCSNDLGSDANYYLPISGLFQGHFVIFSEDSGQPNTVHDWLRRPLVGVHSGRIVVVSNKTEEVVDGGMRMSGIQRVPVSAKDFATEIRDSAIIESSHPIIPELRGVPEKYLGSRVRFDHANQGTLIPTASPIPLEVLPSSQDVGTRITEVEFLNILRRMADETN